GLIENGRVMKKRWGGWRLVSGVTVLISVLVWAVWFSFQTATIGSGEARLNEAPERSLPLTNVPKPSALETAVANETPKREVLTPEPADTNANEKAAAASLKSPLNLTLPQASSKKEDSMGPFPTPEPDPSGMSGTNSTPKSINQLLPDKPIERKNFDYGYEGRDKEAGRYDVNVGVQDKDEEVKVKFGVGVLPDDKRTDLNSIEIEMKLPK
ncbi:MAG: hypothetical protein ACP5D0_04615, partial [Hydrogenovibrio sp.]